uniref:Uncharacterized protein n=1 Tax=Arion vulgaris TaxID=1028688 RepID=A0A0B7AFM2_9EUPU
MCRSRCLEPVSTRLQKISIMQFGVFYTDAMLVANMLVANNNFISFNVDKWNY